jgi:hypothetical protein
MIGSDIYSNLKNIELPKTYFLTGLLYNLYRL